MIPVALLILGLVTAIQPGTAPAQQPTAPPDRTIDVDTRRAVIDSVLSMLNRSYVFPDVARSVTLIIQERARRGEYDRITSARDLGSTLTDALRALAKDQHLGVRYWPLPTAQARREPTAEERREAERRELARINHTFQRVERLPGNIGYVEFFGFMDADAGAATVAATMNFVANTDALIFDLRGNGGGTPEMVALISSYLLPPDPIHLNTMYWREGDSTRQFWTRRGILGERYLDRDVYILTSRRTFSAAEEFAYNLRSLKRVTIVGETTGGGAHPGMMIRFLHDYEMFVPMGRAINPITKTNWEGAGVRPDVEVPADHALIVARMMILRRSVLGQQEQDVKAGMHREIERLENELRELRRRN